MTHLETAASIIDYSISTNNRKRILSSIEIGLGLLFIALGVGTALCEVNDKNKEYEYESQYLE